MADLDNSTVEDQPTPDAWAQSDVEADSPQSQGSPVGVGSSGTLPRVSRSDRKRQNQGEVSTTRWIIETLVLLGVALVIAQGIKSYVMQPYVVPSGSMIPAIQINDRILANKFVFLGDQAPEAGDVVVLDDPTGQFPMLVKRVIAVGGQTIDFIDGKVMVDGKHIIEPYTFDQETLPQSQDMPYVIPDDHVWVMGDNRNDSADSRSFGSVPASSVRGKAFWTYWPTDHFGELR